MSDYRREREQKRARWQVERRTARRTRERERRALLAADLAATTHHGR